MSERIRLTIAGIATILLLAAVSVAGIVAHTAAPVPTATTPVTLTTHAAQPAPTPNWNEELD